LNKIKTRFREETFTRESIREVIQAHPELVRMLYINFAMTHCKSIVLDTSEHS
jgi:glutamate dehydrogenase